jgi:hypothetical protein
MDERREQNRRTCILVIGFITTLLTLSANALTRHDELDASWRSYASNRSSTEPAYMFPHTTCFGAAALKYDLP